MTPGDFLPSLEVADRITAVGIIIVFAIFVITDRLVWHTRLERAEARADRWERIALDALATGAKSGVRAAEAAVEVVSNIPDPNREAGG